LRVCHCARANPTNPLSSLGLARVARACASMAPRNLFCSSKDTPS
jgi:hypothetical protein